MAVVVDDREFILTPEKVKALKARLAEAQVIVTGSRGELIWGPQAKEVFGGVPEEGIDLVYEEDGSLVELWDGTCKPGTPLATTSLYLGVYELGEIPDKFIGMVSDALGTKLRCIPTKL
jgi:hypothetical protein